MTTTTTLLPWGGEQLATQRGEIRDWGRGGERRPNYTRYRPTSKEPTVSPPSHPLRTAGPRTTLLFLVYPTAQPAVGDADLTSPRCSLSLFSFPPFSFFLSVVSSLLVACSCFVFQWSRALRSTLQVLCLLDTITTLSTINFWLVDRVYEENGGKRF